MGLGGEMRHSGIQRWIELEGRIYIGGDGDGSGALKLSNSQIQC